jgi:hypothetical protein
MTSIKCPNCNFMVAALGQTGVCNGCETGRASQPPPKPKTEIQAFLDHADEQDPYYEHLCSTPSQPPLRQNFGDIVKAHYGRRDGKPAT